MSSNEATANSRSARQFYSRRKFVRVAALGASLPLSAGLLAACGGEATPTVGAPTSTTAAAATTAPATSAAAAATTAPATSAATVATTDPTLIKSPASGVPDVSLDPPPGSPPRQLIKATNGVPGRGATVRIAALAYGAPPAVSKPDNQWLKELEKQLGVSLEVNLIPASSYNEKISVLSASGDLPDLVFLDPSGTPEQLKQIQQGVYTDLTSFLTGEDLKEYNNLAVYPDLIWKNSAIRGKIYGVPRPRYLINNVTGYRKDWAEAVGISSVKNADDFYKLMEAFTKNDPDGNGKADTWGLGVGNVAAPFELIDHPIIMGMFKVPNRWRQEADGSLTYYVSTPEYKEALTYLRKLWQDGLIYPDGLSQSKQQLQDNFNGGKYGTIQDNVSVFFGPYGKEVALKKSNDKARLEVLVPPGYNGGKGVQWLAPGYFGMMAIPSKIGKDKEKVKELLRVLNWFASPGGSQEKFLLSSGVDKVHSELKPDGSRAQTDQGKKEMSNDIQNIANAPLNFYAGTLREDGLKVQDIISRSLDIGVGNPALTAVSATWTSRGKELSDFLQDRLTGIIVGRAPLSDFDGVVRDWKSRGGGQVAKEYAESLKG